MIVQANAVRRFFTIGLVLFGITRLASQSPASTLDYLFSGSASGSFAGIPFTNATVTFNCYADTSNIVYSVNGAQQMYKAAAAYGTVSVDGVINVVPLTTQLSVFISTLSGSPQFTTLGLQGPSGDLLDFNDSNLYSYDLSALATISGLGNYNGASFYVVTTLGVLVINSPSFASASYSATASTIPTSSPSTIFQFSLMDPTITFETGTTALPGINGVHLGPYGFGGDSTFSSACFGKQIYGNANGTGYLDISFDQPVQGVGAWFTIGNGNGVTEVAYDQSNNVIDSVTRTMTPPGGGPPFISLFEPTTNIYKVEWRYVSATYFGVDNILYQPAPSMMLSNAPAADGQVAFRFQTLPGHTNIVQTRTDLISGGWIDLTNATFLGMGEIRQLSFPITNSATGFFRVRAE